jgi:hypothetical protein
MNTRHISLFAVLVVALSGCATDPRTGSSQDTIIAVTYGTVAMVEQVKLDASTGKGAMIGGGVGLLAASSHSAGSQAVAALGGALLGAFIADKTAGTGDRYTINLVSGGTIAIVTEHHDIAVGDCVSVEQGKHANIRRVSSAMCNTSPSHPAYNEINASHVGDAQACETAKQSVINATTKDETDIAYTKMRALCE